VVSPSSPHMTIQEFEKTAHVLFLEYFENGDTQEVADSLDELNIKNFKPEVNFSCQSLSALPWAMRVSDNCNNSLII